MADVEGEVHRIRTRLTRGPRAALRADELLEVALRRSHRGDFTDRSFVRPFELLLEAAHAEADLSALGRRALRFDALRFLRNQLTFDALEAASPAVLARPIRAPIFIAGMPRSGTTFLHRLILKDPQTMAPRLWQLVHPRPARSGALASAVRKGWVGLQLAVFRALAPELSALHPVALDAPEECTEITAHVFQSLRFESTYRVPSYGRWLERRGLLAAYRFHRRFLQHLDAERPGRRWVLKSPDHVFALEDLRAVYPDAHLVFIHRDPVRVLASVARLTEVLRRPFTRHIDRAEIGRHVSTAWLQGAHCMSELAARGEPVLHLTYRQVIADPLEAVRRIYDHCGLALGAEAQAAMRSWLRSAVNLDRPRPSYELADYGLDAGLQRERFAHYTNRFGIEPERNGTRTSKGALA